MVLPVACGVQWRWQLEFQVARSSNLPAGRILTDAVERRFEYNLIPFPPTLKNRLGSISANPAGIEQSCERGEDTRIVNQQ
jgi:hypothetical protein